VENAGKEGQWMNKCLTCKRCVSDKEEPYLLVCAKGHVGLSDKWTCEDYKMENFNMIRVYIAGTLNGMAVDYINNVHKMIKVAELVRTEGVGVFIPCLDFLCGVVHGNWTYEQYFQMNQPWLEVCDAVFLVPGWEKSKGTARELATAKALGIPRFEKLDVFVSWLEQKEKKNARI